MIKEDEAPPPSRVAWSAVWSAAYPVVRPVESMGGVLGGIVQSAPAAVPKVATPKRVQVSSGVVSGLLIRKVQPHVSAAGQAGPHLWFGHSPGRDRQGWFD